MRCRLIPLALLAGLLTVAAVELPPGFVAETIATNLNAATAIAPAPDGRIFILDQTGPLLVWKDGRVLDRPALNLANRVDSYWERGLIGVALAPAFPREPHLFVLYVAKSPYPHHVLSRFTVSGDEIDPATEVILLEGDDQSKLGGQVPAGHQGGAIRFGPDGRLYVSLGEQTAGELAQRLDTLQGKILRLNPDGSIPDDNPLLTRTTGKYRALYALGVRNSFGIAVQPKADGGRMFFTDVGGSAFEEVNELKPGANYGWPRAEGFSTNAVFTNPLHAYPPMIGQSIVGGAFHLKTCETDPHVGCFPPKWRGQFFFADFMKHWIKALDPDAPTNVLPFARGLNGPVATEFAPDGSLLVLNRGAIWRDPRKFVPNAGSLIRIRHTGGTLAREAPASDSARLPSHRVALGLPMDANSLPRLLTRADWEARFRDTKRWPFWLNTSAWQPFVHERIGLYLPTGTAITLSDDQKEVRLPPGAVVVRDFSMMDWQPPLRRKGDFPHDVAPRRLETRLLVAGAPRGYAASYRWTEPDTAELIEDGELRTIPDVLDMDSTTDALRRVSLSWWFPGVDDVVFPITHPVYWISTAVEDFILPSSPDQPGEPGFRPNWLRSMQRAGALQTAWPLEKLDTLPSGTMWIHLRQSPEKRVRSYLHGNCAVCHQPGGASRGNLDLRLATPLTLTGLLDAAPVAGDLGIAGAKLVAPGAPEKSILLRRLRDTGFFRMPPVQTHNEPSPIIPVMEEWIRTLKSQPRTQPGPG